MPTAGHLTASVAVSEVYQEKGCIYQGSLSMKRKIDLLGFIDQSLLEECHNSKKKAG
jgi:hypothetical protein